MTDPPVCVCIIGAGPRGLSVLERLCANAGDTRAQIHVVDPYPPGAGKVWRTDQSRHLLMNTVACQVTIFTDDTVDMHGPVAEGPSLYEWARLLPFLSSAAAAEDPVRSEALSMQPNSYPTRAFYGHYLRWAFGKVVEQAPAGVSVQVHLAQVVQLRDERGGRQHVLLDDGTAIRDVDAVVLAQGHVPHAPNRDEAALGSFAAARGRRYVPPANPADVDLSFLEPAEPVMLRGLGLCFFDYLTLLTAGRGGTFERDGEKLIYRASGREPRVYAGSRRGVPHHARGDNEKGAFGRHVPRVLSLAAVGQLRARGLADGGVDFRRDVWPLLAKETETVYYSTLLARSRCGCDVDRFRESYLAVPWGDAQESDLLNRFGIAGEDRWDWQAVMDPSRGRRFAGTAAFRDWAIDHLRADVAQARLGNVSSPLKAALDVLRDLRNEVRGIVDHGGLSGRSHRDDLDGWYTSVNAFLSIGPPAQRVEETIALLEAGVLTLVGADVRVTTDASEGCFVVHSGATADQPVRVRTLVEARVGEPDLRRASDPLLRQLFQTSQVCPHRIADGRHGYYETAGLAVTQRPYQVLDAKGTPHPRRFAFGVPTESVHWVTAAGIRPGVGSIILADADAIARRVLSIHRAPRTARMPDNGRPARTGNRKRTTSPNAARPRSAPREEQVV